MGAGPIRRVGNSAKFRLTADGPSRETVNILI
jgi:hypothetical protein